MTRACVPHGRQTGRQTTLPFLVSVSAAPILPDPGGQDETQIPDLRLGLPLMRDADLLRLGLCERRVEQATMQIAVRIGEEAAIRT